MSDNNVIKLAQPGAFTDSLTEILRNGARALLTQAVEAEVAEFLAKHADPKTETGQQRVVRHGHLPEREIMTGIGPVAVRQPRVRDREATEGERIRYSPSILPPYARRSKSLEVLIPSSPKPAKPEPNRRRRQNSSSAVRAILDDPPIHIRPVCSRKRGCEGKEPCGFNAFQHAHGCTPPPLRPPNSSHVLSQSQLVRDYASSQTGLRKSGPRGQFEAGVGCL